MPWHKIQPGEWMEQIAYQYGFTDWKAIFDLPENQPLRDKKRDPNQLLPGEHVFLPSRTRKTADVSVGKSHKFVAKRTSQTLSVAVHDEKGQPLKSKPFKIRLGTKEITGTSDGSGLVKIVLPPEAQDATLEIGDYEIELHPGHLDPVSALSGLLSRLLNLGFDAGEGGDREQLQQAVKRFQKANGLAETGEADDTTRQKLVDKHGC
jgi:hypothetical protein